MPADLPAVPSEGNHLPTASPPHTVIRDNMRITPSFWDRLEDWWFDHPKQKTVAALAGACVIYFFAALWLAARPAEMVIAGGLTEPVYAEVRAGQDLGDVGRPYGKTRLEMIALNEALIVENTAECDRLGSTTDNCARAMFAGRVLAWNALWAGNMAVVGTRQVDPITLTTTR